MPNQTRQIPASECTFRAELQIKQRENDENKSTPFQAVARTGDAVNHRFWGRVVHDLDGMKVKSRIPVDFNHNPNEVVGYARHFNTDSGDLQIAGAITPSRHEANGRAQEIIDKGEQGVPWEMSITFPGDMKLEEVPEGKQVSVNQRTFTGPLTVIREWSLRGVAVTPYGHDPKTSMEFAAGDEVTATVLNEESTEMADETTKETPGDEVKAEADTVDTQDNDSAEAAQAVEAKPEAAAAAETALSAEPEKPKAPGDAHMALFGRVPGALYFADGVSLEDAKDLELARLQAELAKKQESKPVTPAEADLEQAVGFSAGGGEIESDLLTEVPGDRVEEVVEKKNTR